MTSVFHRHVSCYFSDDKISILAEMFPDACSLEIEHCLAVAHGDAESAVQLMLLKGAENSYEDEGKENSPGSIDFSPKVRGHSVPVTVSGARVNPCYDTKA